MARHKETLVMLTPGFAQNEGDTTCLPAHQQFIRALNNNFPSLKVIILPFQYPFTRKEYDWHSNAVIPCDGRNKKKIHKLFLWHRVWKSLKKIQKENQVIGILSLWCTECAWIGKRFGKKHLIRHYSWILGQDARKGNKFVTLVSPQSNELIALSDFIQQEFEKNYRIKPAHVIPLGIDPSLSNDNFIKKDLDILAVGSLISLKQYDIFIEVINALVPQFPALKTILCGSGPQETWLKSHVEKMHLKNNIELTGERSHPQVMQLMRRAKIFLHTSSYEGFGIVCLEALYSGAHVVSFCKPMNAAITNWHIVKDKEEMIRKTAGLLQMAVKKPQKILPYSINNTAEQVMKLFDYSEAAIR